MTATLVSELPSLCIWFASQALHTGRVRVEGLPNSSCGGPQQLLSLGQVLPIDGCVCSQSSRGEWRSFRMQLTTRARLAGECWVEGLPSSSCGKPQLLLGVGLSGAGCGCPQPIVGNWTAWKGPQPLLSKGLPSSSCGGPQPLLSNGLPSSRCGGPQLLLGNGLPNRSCVKPQLLLGNGLPSSSD